MSAPTTELQTLDALAARAAEAPVGMAPALRASSVQRLQLRAGNAAVAAMLQRRAAPQVRRPPPAVQRKATPTGPGTGSGVVGVTAKATTIHDGPGSSGGTESSTVEEAPSVETSWNVGAASSALALLPPPGAPGGNPPVLQRRSMSSIMEEAKKRAEAPAGPEDTASVEGDTDMSDYTDKPAEARAERAANPPPPPPPKPPVPTALTAKVGDKPPTKPPAKKIGNALVKGPKGKGAGAHGEAKGSSAPGEIVKKPAPPLPPVWKKPPPGKPVGAIPPAPIAVPKTKPKQDPAFNKVTTAAQMTVKKAKKHPTGKDESANAQGAAVPPANDMDAQAKANRADTMATAKPKPFDEEAFVTAVKVELAKTAPKSLSEAGDVGKKAGQAKVAIGAKVGASKDAAAGDVETKSQQPPDPSTATPKPVTPMAPLEIEQPGGMQASGAMPAPVGNEAIDMRQGPAKVDNEMAEAEVTEEQLSKSNEPEFAGALDAKKEGEEHSAQAPADVRKAEGAILKQAAAASATEEKKTVGAANSSIGETIGKVGGQKTETKSKDELKRKEVADHINSIFDKTKKDVDGILAGLETTVDKEFTDGEAAVRSAFTQDWNDRLDAYKDDRYSGLRGKYRWVRDKFKGLPEAANRLFDTSRKLYERSMDALVRRIAATVSKELTSATVRIEQGRGEVAAYVSGLKGDLAKFGQEAATDMSEKFENLDSSVKDKFDDLAGSLAKKYAASRDAVDKEIEDAKEANKGLIDKAIGAIKGIIRVIKQLKDMILNILSKIADVIGRIISDPIGFLKRFLTAVKDGISRFVGRIGEHLQKGLMGWLFGALGATGIEIPDSFSLEGILKLVMSVLGLTWNSVRASLVKKIGEPAMAALESGADIVKKVIKGGPAVLWEMVVEKFTDFEDMVVGEIKSFVIEKVVKAGVSWLLGLLTPAGAFIKACQAIYSIVMFFVERGSEIKEFIESIIDAAGDIARGGAGGVAEKIEGVLAKVLPLAISFLASLLGLGGIGDKVRSIIDKVRSPIAKAMDKVLDVVVKITAPIWKPAKALFNKGKQLYGKAKDKVVKTYEKGKEKVKQVGANIKNAAKSGIAKAKKKVVDTATAAKQKVVGLFKRQEKPMSLKGASHKLIAEPAAKGFQIRMASREDILSRKISEAVESLRDRMATEEGAAKKATAAQIEQLLAIGGIAANLEKRSGSSTVDPKTGAPDGFPQAMTALAGEIQKFAAKNGVTDITKAAEGTVVDLRMLAKFGMPVASYLQAQKVADDMNATIDIRATAMAAPELYGKGAEPKSEDFKQKTVNEEDVKLGIPKEYLNLLAWFRPILPDPAGFSTEEYAALKKRADERDTEYTDNKASMKKKLAKGQAFIIPAGKLDAKGGGGGGGGVIMKILEKVAYTVTGDHDVYQVRGPMNPVIDALRKPPFNVQHGAHLDWPSTAEEADEKTRGKEKLIFAAIVNKHLPGGQSLLRINPKAPPTTANSRPITWEQAEDPARGQVVRAVGPGGGHGTGGGVAATDEQLSKLRAQIKDLKFVDQLVEAAGNGERALAVLQIANEKQLRAWLKVGPGLPAVVQLVRDLSDASVAIDAPLKIAPSFSNPSKDAPSDITRTADLTAMGYPGGADIRHFVMRHTPEYFDWSDIKKDNSLFPAPNSPDKMMARVLSAAKAPLLVHNEETTRSASDGYRVVIRAREVDGALQIVQFFPQGSPSINLRKPIMMALKKFFGA